jgi:hypothetical protein
MRNWLATAAFEGFGRASGLLKKTLGLAALLGVPPATRRCYIPSLGEATERIPSLV